MSVTIKYLRLHNYVLLLYKDMNSLYSIKSLLFTLLPIKIVHLLLPTAGKQQVAEFNAFKMLISSF